MWIVDVAATRKIGESIAMSNSKRRRKKQRVTAEPCYFTIFTRSYCEIRKRWLQFFFWENITAQEARGWLEGHWTRDGEEQVLLPIGELPLSREHILRSRKKKFQVSRQVDEALRAAKFKILSRPQVGPILWTRGGATYTQERAIELGIKKAIRAKPA